MKIGQPADKNVIPGTGTVRSGSTQPVKAGTGQPAAGDAEASAKVELSSTAATLSKKAVNPEFDADKVQQISQAIGDNSYKVNPEKIADKLIANAQELLGKVSK